jgi:threo-3-hydroxy-D-aspartate ammonia-lyase
MVKTRTKPARRAGRLPARSAEPETPALLLHLDVVERNLARMAARARALGVQLRPHAKTHKSVELAKRQLAHGAAGLTVATLVEAGTLARAGVTDLTWAFPLDPTHIPHALRIVAETGATLRVVTDDLATARALRNSGLHVWLKVDCGYHRAGVDPESPYALEVAKELGAERGLTFDGILSHSGHAYRTTSTNEAAEIAESERSVMVRFARRLQASGVPVRSISVGSTPAMVAARDLAGVTEARPGNYVFYDRTMVLIGCCEPEDVGVTVLATVVSHQPGASHFVVDAGALALSKDSGPSHGDLPQAMGSVQGHPELTVASVSQEHGVIRAASPRVLEGKFPVGARIEIVPNHSCLTVAQFDEYHVKQGGRVTARWPIARGR